MAFRTGFLHGGLLAAAMALAPPAMARMQTDAAPAPPAGVESMTPPSPIGPAGPGKPRDPAPGPAGFGTPPIGDPSASASPAGAPPPDTAHTGLHEPGAAQANTGQTTISADKLIGRAVKDAKGETVGEVEDVILSRSGQALNVVLEMEGADKKVAVTFDEMILPSLDADLELTTLTRAELESRQPFKAESGSVSLADQGARK